MAQSSLDNSAWPATEAGALDALIIGAGFCGLYALYSLRERLGLKVRLLEAAEGVGGTWWWNRYPGARCDSESHYYNFSFDKALEQEWEWGERYAAQPEVLRYLNHVADRFDLRRDITFGARVTTAEYDGAANLWRATTQAGERISARFLVTAVGSISAANVPSIPGLETFEGAWYHTALWPHEGVDFAGKRVGLVGTGSTGVQATPVIAERAVHLTVFQRTANYSVPARNGPIDPDFQRQIKADYEAVRRQARATANGHPFEIPQRSALEVTPEEREAIYEAAWAHGGLRFRATFNDLLTSKAANDTAAEFLRAKIAAVVKDPATAEALTPRDHPYAGKRPPIDTGYFEAFNRDNVSLVDLKKTPIEAITPTGIRTTAGEYPLDIIVFATGFDALTGALLKIDIRGEDGIALREVWADGPRTYLGLQVAGFPNLFTLTGPQSPSVLCNLPVPIEQHVEWITDCIARMRAHGLDRIEPTPEAVERWGEAVQASAEATLFPQAASSWYFGANVAGKPRAFLPYAGGMARYRAICDEVAAKGYEGFVISRAGVGVSP